jgi:hypothetical protein
MPLAPAALTVVRCQSSELELLDDLVEHVPVYVFDVE